MKFSLLAKEYRRLPTVSQIEALLRLARELTLIGRATYDDRTLGVRHPERLRTVNEVQHRVSSQVLALLNTGGDRWADEALTAVILNQDDPLLRRQLASAFARSLSLEVVA